LKVNLQELLFRFHSYRYMDIDHTLMNYFVLHIFDSVGFMVQGVYQYLSDSSSILGIVSEALI